MPPNLGAPPSTTLPGPGVAGGPTGTPLTPTAPTGPRGPSASSTGARTKPSPVSDWMQWWENNNDPYLRTLLGAQRVLTENEGFLSGRSRQGHQDWHAPISAEKFRAEVLPVLAQYLRQGDVPLIQAAAIALGRSTPPSAAAPIASMLQPLLSDSRHAVRHGAMLALGILAGEGGKEDLLHIACDTKPGRTLLGEEEGVTGHCRSLAAMSLGIAADAPSADSLLKAMERTSRPSVRAFLLLSAARAAPSSPALAQRALKLLQSHRESSLVRSQAAIALSHLDHNIARAALSTLTRLLNDRKTASDQRISCAVALGSLANSEDLEVVSTLVDRTQDSGDSRIRYFSWIALGRILANDAAVGLLDEKLRSPIVHLLVRGVLRPARKLDRAWSALALGIGLCGEDPESSLLQLAAEKVRECLDAMSTQVEATPLALCLGLLRDTQAVPTMLKLLQKQRGQQETYYLLQAIGLAGNEQARPVLHGMLAEEKMQPRVQTECARALALLGDTTAVDLLADRLAASSNLTEIQALTSALAAFRTETSLRPLLELLKDSSRPVESRRYAANAIGYLAERTQHSWFAPYVVDSNYLVSHPAGKLLFF